MNEGTVTHNRERHDLDKLLELVKDRAVDHVAVDRVRWIINATAVGNYCNSCKYGPESWHEARIEHADLDCPILVFGDWDVKAKRQILYVLDGLHRLIKATRLGLEKLPCRWVVQADLHKARSRELSI